MKKLGPHGVRVFAASTIIFLTLSPADVQAGNTTCAGNLTDWYTSAVGETACKTYERLRQICNSNYEVPDFRSSTPGDQCDDLLQNCCCNSVSWALSMLCMNCQWDIMGGSMNGIDAGVGAYQLYRNATGKWCSPATNRSLPIDVQSAGCSIGIKLDNFLYDLFWEKGDWYFVYTMEYAGEQQAEFNNNTFAHCNSTTSTMSAIPVVTSSITAATSPSALPATATSPSSTQSSLSHSNTGSVIGSVVGGVAGLVLTFVVGFVCWRKRHRSPPAPAIDIDDGIVVMSVVTPYPCPSQDHSDAQPSSQTGMTPKHRFRPVHTDVSSDGVPGSNVSTSGPSQNTPGVVRSRSQADPDRHEDLGPVSSLCRSDSGRLPPAYDPNWEGIGLHELPARPLPQPTEPTTTDTISSPSLASRRKSK